MGLDDIMAGLYAENRSPSYETAEEIIERLELKNNYIPSSEKIRREYLHALLMEYKTYIKDRLEE